MSVSTGDLWIVMDKPMIGIFIEHGTCTARVTKAVLVEIGNIGKRRANLEEPNCAYGNWTPVALWFLDEDGYFA